MLEKFYAEWFYTRQKPSSKLNQREEVRTLERKFLTFHRSTYVKNVNKWIKDF